MSPQFRPGLIRVPKPKGEKVRVPDYSLKVVAYVAEVLSEDTDAEAVDRVATGFFVNIPSRVIPNMWFAYFVTAKHVAMDLQKKRSTVIINTKDGGVTTLKMLPTWWPHPNDDTVDVAVTPCIIEPTYDIMAIPESLFITPEIATKASLGIGDEIFMVGLFSAAPGVSRNQPIVRIGNIAMLPQERIQVEGRFSEVHLVEARSIGGMSGSPVFINKLAYTRQILPDGTDSFDQRGNIWFFGLTHGHWDVREADINSPTFIQDRQRGVNMGIAVVVPAHKILEAINHPHLVAMRAAMEAAAIKQVSPEPDVER